MIFKQDSDDKFNHGYKCPICKKMVYSDFHICDPKNEDEIIKNCFGIPQLDLPIKTKDDAFEILEKMGIDKIFKNIL